MYNASNMDINTMLPGKLYELAIFTNTLLNNPDKQFDIGQEIIIGDKFDDLVVRDINHQYAFVQIKLVNDTDDKGKKNLIDSKVLLGKKKISLNKDDFKLQKYLLSCLRIKDQLKSRSKNNSIAKLIIFTNADLNHKEVAEEIGAITVIRNLDDFILNTNKNLESYIITKPNKNFIRNMLENLKSDLEILAEELAKYVTDCNINLEPMVLDVDCFRYYHTALLDENVMEIRDCQLGNKKIRLGKFTQNFIDDTELSNRAQRVRTILIEQNNNPKLLENMTKAEWKVSDDFGVTESIDGILLPSYAISERDVEDFFGILEFRVNQLGVKDLLNKIKDEEIKKKILEYSDTNPKLVEFLINDFVQGWRNESISRERWLLNSKRTEFIKQLQIKIAKPQVIHTTQEFVKYIESIIIKYNLQFHDACLFNENHFFKDNKETFFLISTASNILSSIKMLEYLKKKNIGNYIFIDLERLADKREIVKLVDALQDDKYSLFIISYKSLADINIVEELFNKLSDIRKHRNKQVIFITSKADCLIKKINIYKEYKDKTTGTEHLVNSSRLKILEQHITFQGKTMPISNLCKQVDPEILDRLITNYIDIGNSAANISYLEGAHSEIFEAVNMESFVNELSSLKSTNIFIISGVPGLHKADRLLKEMCITEETTANAIKNQMKELDHDSLTRLKNRIHVGDHFKDSTFKHLCKINSKSKIYWINFKKEGDKSNFILLKVYNPGFYITGKRFYDKVVIKNEIKELLASSQLREVFIIVGINKKKFVSWLQMDSNKVKQFEVNCDKFIQFQSHCEDNLFKGLIEENLTKTVHLLKFELGELFWCKTHGSIESLSKYGTQDYKSSHALLEENELIKEIRDKKVLILAGEPGIGKSTTMVKLYDTKCNLQSGSQESITLTHWVIRVNLKDHLHIIKNIDFNYNDQKTLTQILNFLSQIDKNLNDISKTLLGKALVDESFGKPVLVAFDGFDDILDELDRNKVTLLLNQLNHKTKAKIWITTRLQYKKSLEIMLSTFAIKIEAMDSETVRTFIKTYLRDHSSVILSYEEVISIFDRTDKSENSSTLHKYIDAFLSKILDIFKSDVSCFIGTPLQLYLMLEGSARYFKKWAKNRADQKPDFSYLGNDIWEVYQMFVSRKYGTYLKKRDIEGAKQSLEKTVFDNYHRGLAKSLILESEIKPPLEELLNVILSVGIVRSDGGKIEFIHSSLKEFYAAKLFIYWIEKWTRERQSVLTNLEKKSYLCEHILSKPFYQVIRTFLNVKLLHDDLKNAYLEEKNYREEILLLTIVENNVGIANFLLHNFHTASVDEPETPEHLFQKSPIESAAFSGNLEMLKLFMKFSKQTEHLDELCSSLLHDATESSNIDVVQYLLNNGANINTTGKFCEPVIYKAVAKCGNLEMVKFLIEKGVDVSEFPCGGTALSIAAQHGDLDTVKFLVQKGADVNGTDKYGEKVICSAIARDDNNFEMIQFLVQNGAKMDVKYRLGGTLICKAASQPGNIDIVRFLVQNGANVNDTDDCGDMALNIAADLEIFKLLVENGANFSNIDIKGFMCKAGLNTLDDNLRIVKYIPENCVFNSKNRYESHILGVGDGVFKTIKLLIKSDLNNDCQDISYNTLKNRADDDFYNNEIMNFLMKNGLDVNYRNAEGKTALYYVVKYGNLEMVQFFVRHGADINNRDNNGQTVLYTAVARPNNIRIVEFLSEHGACVNSKDNNGETVIFTAAAKHFNLKVVRFLIQNGADIHSKNSNGLIALDIAVMYNDIAIVKLLVQNGANVNNTDNYGISVTSRAAARRNNIEMIKYLLEQGAHVNATLVYSASTIRENLKMIEYLVQIGIKLDATDKDCEAALCDAVEHNDLKIVKFFVENGANVNAQDSQGMKVLINAVVRGNLEMVRYLVESGADINARDNTGMTVIQKAISHSGLRHKLRREKWEDEEEISILVSHGYYEQNQIKIINFLLQNPKLDARVKDSVNLLKIATKFIKLQILKVLIEYCRNNGYLDQRNSSILCAAAETGNTEMVKFFIGNLNINNSGITLLCDK